MVENEARGCNGCFSVAGRNSSEKYKILHYRDQVLAGKQIGTVKVQYETTKDDQVEDYLDIFGVDYNDKKPETQTQNLRCKSAKTIAERYKYHNQHKIEGRKPKKHSGPGCTKYNPKKDYIMTRTPKTTPWVTQTKRKPFIEKEDDTQYYLNHEDITNHKAGKSFIDMTKMSMRGDLILGNDLRVQNIKPFNRVRSAINFGHSKSNLESEMSSHKQITVSNNSNRKSSNISKGISRKSSFIGNRQSTSSFKRSGSSLHVSKIISQPVQKEEKLTESSLNDSYDEYKHIYQKAIKKRPVSAIIIKEKQKKKEKNKIKAPDLKRNISREHLDMLDDHKSSVIPFSLPNFELVRERPIMMVKYDRIRHKKMKREPIKGMENCNFNPDKYINRINNHSVASPPDFNLMTSRPENDGPLPLYMKKIYSRVAAYETTDLTLKMNNYVDSKFATHFSAFWPKKTFNKIINLNLLNSKKFLDNLMLKNGNGHDAISKSMKFYHKNYEDLLRENMLSQFDGVTYKTYKKHTKLNPQDIETFIYNYQMDEGAIK